MSGNTPDDEWTLREVKAWIEEQKATGGAHCPACEQWARIYHRPLSSAMVQSLIKLYGVAGLQFAHFPTVLRRKQSDETKMEYWGLIEEERILRPDGGRAGYWRVTPLGQEFIRGKVRMASHAWVYNGRCLGLDNRRMVLLGDILPKGFDLRELLAELYANRFASVDHGNESR